MSHSKINKEQLLADLQADLEGFQTLLNELPSDNLSEEHRRFLEDRWGGMKDVFCDIVSDIKEGKYDASSNNPKL